MLAALPHFERFLEHLRERPMLRRLIRLDAAIYTQNAEAMALNNLGTARLHLTDLPAAKSAWEQARGLDPKAPLPVYNLARPARVEGRAEEATELLTLARGLGFSQAKSDRLISTTSAILARIEGAGRSVPPPGHCIHCGYNLTGNVSGLCPECGSPIEPCAPPPASPGFS